MDLCYIYFTLFLFHQTAGGLDETFFKTIDDLIRHYKRKNQGLAMHLRHSVKRKTALLIQPHREVQAQPSKSPEQRPRRTECEQWRQPDTVPEEEHDYESTPYIFSVSVLFCLISVSQHLLWFVCLTFSLFSSRCSWIWVRRSPSWLTSAIKHQMRLLGEISDKKLTGWISFRMMTCGRGHIVPTYIIIIATCARVSKLLLQLNYSKCSWIRIPGDALDLKKSTIWLSAPIRMNCSNSTVLFSSTAVIWSKYELTAIQTWDATAFSY